MEKVETITTECKATKSAWCANPEVRQCINLNRELEQFCQPKTCLDKILVDAYECNVNLNNFSSCM
jgi:hypothetical protein